MKVSRGTILTIRTPEGILFALPLASPVSRCLAWMLDLLVIAALTGVVGKALASVEAISRDVAAAGNVIAYFVISIGYGIACEWHWRGQTIGKRMLRLRVVDAQGLRLQFSQVVLRNLLRFVDLLPGLYLVGGLGTVLSRHAQRLGDMAANTVVVRLSEAAQPDLDQVTANKYNSLLEAPHLAARLRQNVPPEAAQIALQAVLRRDQMEPLARAQLFRELRDYFSVLVTFPTELTEQITDEQYIRNVVQVLFQRSAKATSSPLTVTV